MFVAKRPHTYDPKAMTRRKVVFPTTSGVLLVVLCASAAGGVSGGGLRALWAGVEQEISLETRPGHGAAGQAGHSGG